MRPRPERGVALIVTLFLMLAISVVGASLMFLSQTETYATMNYRMMSQARYAAEAGVQKASNFLFDSSQYAVPAPGATDDVNAYDRTVSPVQYNGQSVVLSADSSVPSNYPVQSVATAFAAAAKGTMTADNAAIAYRSVATLISMEKFDAYGGTAGVAQTWSITGTGSLDSPRNATVQVTGVVEVPKVTANTYAAFATADTCGAIYFHGNTTIDSYDSRAGTPSTTTEQSEGDVGTNGNLEIQGSVDVQGNLYSPRTGVGTCEEGAVVALTQIGHADVQGSVVQLPTALTFPPPVFSTLPPTTQVTINSTLFAGGASSVCSQLGLTLGTNCSVNYGSKTVTVNGGGPDVTLPSVTVAGGYTLVLVGHSPTQTVNINSINGGGALQVQANMSGPGNEAVMLKVAGLNADGTEMAAPIDLSTMAWKQNSTVPQSYYDAAAFQIAYGGHGTLYMTGNSQSAGMVYAPNAEFHLQGTADYYGSVLAHTIINGGDADIHYDRRLSSEFYVVGHPMMESFSWTRVLTFHLP